MSSALIGLIVSISAFIVLIIYIISSIKSKTFTFISLICYAVVFIIMNIGLFNVLETIIDNDGKIAVSYITEATVIAVGSKGITVEYYDEKDGYGEKTATTAKITTAKEKYQIGDTVTIQVDKNVFVNPTTNSTPKAMLFSFKRIWREI